MFTCKRILDNICAQSMNTTPSYACSHKTASPWVHTWGDTFFSSHAYHIFVHRQVHTFRM